MATTISEGSCLMMRKNRAAGQSDGGRPEIDTGFKSQVVIKIKGADWSPANPGPAEQL
jgi:hypothetical protein